MFDVLFVCGCFSFIAVVAVKMRNKLRKIESLCDPVLRKSEKLLATSGLAASAGFPDKEAVNMDRLFAMMFRRNKSGVLSFRPLVVMLFFGSFFVFFPFNSLFHK